MERAQNTGRRWWGYFLTAGLFMLSALAYALAGEWREVVIAMGIGIVFAEWGRRLWRRSNTGPRSGDLRAPVSASQVTGNWRSVGDVHEP
jgi:hypothetical protein